MVKFKKPYIGKIQKKIFEAKSIFIVFYFFEKLNKNVKVKLRTTSGKKICTVKFSKQEFYLIEQAAKSNDQTIEQFFTDLFKQIADGVK